MENGHQQLGQQLRPEAERALPEWRRDALDRERGRARNIQDVFDAIEGMKATLADIQARLYVLENAK